MSVRFFHSSVRFGDALVERVCTVTETQSARAGLPAGAIPTVDFLLHYIRRAVKKVGVKSHD
jgi:hypothetical protein